jgi:hypothetical protein
LRSPTTVDNGTKITEQHKEEFPSNRNPPLCVPRSQSSQRAAATPGGFHARVWVWVREKHGWHSWLVGLIYAKLKEKPWKISVCRGRLSRKVAVSCSLTVMILLRGLLCPAAVPLPTPFPLEAENSKQNKDSRIALALAKRTGSWHTRKPSRQCLHCSCR